VLSADWDLGIAPYQNLALLSRWRTHLSPAVREAGCASRVADVLRADVAGGPARVAQRPVGGHNWSVSRRDKSLLAQIERGGLDDRVPLKTVLWTCISLGAQTRNAELRDWAGQELDGYRHDDSAIPEYRVIHAPLKLDGATRTHRITGQQISSFQLPDMARDIVTEEVKVAHGVGDLEALVRGAEREGKSTVKMVPPGGADLVMLMNHEAEPGNTVMALYWDVSVARITGVLDHIRTRLVQLVAEMRATMGEDETVPSSESAQQAVNVVFHKGKRHQVNINTAQATDGGSAVATAAPTKHKESWWTKTITIWTVIGVLVAIVAAYIAYRAWHG
jgi:AbiTii